MCIRDSCNTALPDLPVSATASLFGKADSNASQEDIACGILYTVLQTLGGAAVLSALNSPIKDFVLIGNLTQLPQCREVVSKMEAIYHVHFHIPDVYKRQVRNGTGYPCSASGLRERGRCWSAHGGRLDVYKRQGLHHVGKICLHACMRSACMAQSVVN